MVGCVGADELGRQALAALADQNVAADFVAPLPAFPTGTVTVQVDPSGQPSYRFGPDDAWDHLPWSEGLAQLAAGTHAVCFGTLGQRHATVRETIQRFLAATPTEAWRVLDINLRSPFYNDSIIRQSLAAANVLKLNDEELPIVAAVCDVPGRDVAALAALAKRYKFRAAALTRGARGSVLLRGDELSECSGMPVTVRDTVGAGDAFSAALTLGLLRGDELERINRRACEIAAFVCSQPGATPSLPIEITRGFWDEADRD